MSSKITDYKIGFKNTSTAHYTCIMTILLGANLTNSIGLRIGHLPPKNTLNRKPFNRVCSINELNRLLDY